MKRLCVGLFLLFATFNLFAQRQEIGRVFFELRAYEREPWTGTCYNLAGVDMSNHPTVGRKFMHPARVIITTKSSDPILSASYRDFITYYTDDIEKRLNGSLISRTNTSADIYLPYKDRMVLLNTSIRMDSFAEEKNYGCFENYVRAILLYYYDNSGGVRLSPYQKIWDWNHYEQTWLNSYDANGYYFVKIEFVLYK